MANNKPIEEWLNEQPSNTSPSDSATLLGLDNGETVKIPISKFPVIETDELIPDRKMLNGEYEFTDILLARGGIIVENGTGISLHYQGDRGNNTIDLFCNEDSKIQCLSMDNGFNYKTEILATEQYVDEKISSLPSGGGSSSGGGGGIVDVTELPTENTSAIYRVEEIESTKMLNVVGNEDGSFTISINEGADVYIVDTLPEVGVPMVDMTTGWQTFYMTKDQQCYFYMTEDLAELLGAPSASWFSFADMGAITVIVNSIDEITNPDTSGQTMYVLVVKQQRLYYHNGREFVKLSNTTDDLSIPIPVANETTVGGLKYSFDESTATLTLIFD